MSSLPTLSAEPDVEPLYLTKAQRSWRYALTALLATGFMCGSVIGNDHWWPFAPWRMFSVATIPNTSVSTLALEVREEGSTTWKRSPILLESIGVNRAEVEGRASKIAHNDAYLVAIAQAHARIVPQDPAWVGVRIVRISRELDGRNATGRIEQSVVGEWNEADR